MTQDIGIISICTVYFCLQLQILLKLAFLCFLDSVLKVFVFNFLEKKNPKQCLQGENFFFLYISKGRCEDFFLALGTFLEVT